MEENNKKRKDKKVKKQKQHNKDKEVAEQELDKMIKQVEDQYGIDRSQFKIVKIKMPQRNTKYILLELLGYLVLNTVLLLSISGYVNWAAYETIYDLVWFVIAFSLLEIILKNITFVMMKKLVYRTLGMLLIIPTLFAILLMPFITSFVLIESAHAYLFTFIMLLLVRNMIKNFLFNKKRGKFYG